MDEQQEPSKMTRDQLKLLALKQRIGEITSDYEDRIAGMRAVWTEQTEGWEAKVKGYHELIAKQESDIEKLQTKLRESNVAVQEDADTESTSH
jgi:hypothetical protein